MVDNKTNVLLVLPDESKEGAVLPNACRPIGNFSWLETDSPKTRGHVAPAWHNGANNIELVGMQAAEQVRTTKGSAEREVVAFPLDIADEIKDHSGRCRCICET